MSLKLYTDKSEIFECNVSLEGASIKNSKLRAILKFDDKNLIHWGKNKPYKKLYLHESKGRPIQNFWNDIHPITRSEKNKRQ